MTRLPNRQTLIDIAVPLLAQHETDTDFKTEWIDENGLKWLVRKTAWADGFTEVRVRAVLITNHKVKGRHVWGEALNPQARIRWGDAYTTNGWA